MMLKLIDTVLLAEARNAALDRAVFGAGILSLSVAVFGTLTLYV
ncbi:hypothetical protein [Profundibacterium mesophilum]|uniref:Uncharacterized protein n=1 Tax=Profundibacterium mesophilum KAUST100406-0324 TaxID=1037889 RepID=A0A921NW91_9RHOB|nr:hypothetical protein [Profundibacterium mesophilum]KAF0676630.1 hypothetical protein PMES_01362 [Profundibacterium mesophilum KAUST100406-0324]